MWVNFRRRDAVFLALISSVARCRWLAVGLSAWTYTSATGVTVMTDCLGGVVTVAGGLDRSEIPSRVEGIDRVRIGRVWRHDGVTERERGASHGPNRDPVAIHRVAVTLTSLVEADHVTAT
jgi:hypothetical protein